VPESKRSKYAEIWAGDLLLLSGFRYLAYQLDTVRVGSNLRWQSLNNFTQKLIAVLFGFSMVVSSTLIDYRLGDLVLAVLLFAASFLVDFRRNRFRRAVEALATYYLVMWSVFFVHETVIRGGGSNQFTIFFSVLVALSVLVAQVLWLLSVKDFDDARSLRLLGALLFVVALPMNLVARLFVGMASYLPEKFIQDFHQLFSKIDGFSQLTFWALVASALIFHLKDSSRRVTPLAA
jgi:hypothetical protein